MFGIGFMEIMVIAVVALVFVGPSRLPELLRTAAKFFVQARRISSDVKSSFDEAIFKAEADLIRKERDDMKRLLQSAPAVKLRVDEKPEGSISQEIDLDEELSHLPSKDEN